MRDPSEDFALVLDYAVQKMPVAAAKIAEAEGIEVPESTGTDHPRGEVQAAAARIADERGGFWPNVLVAIVMRNDISGD